MLYRVKSPGAIVPGLLDHWPEIPLAEHESILLPKIAHAEAKMVGERRQIKFQIHREGLSHLCHGIESRPAPK